jgi:hypothetical protein
LIKLLVLLLQFISVNFLIEFFRFFVNKSKNCKITDTK